MTVLHFHLPRVLRIRLPFSLRGKTNGYRHDDLLRAGGEPARQPALMTRLHGGRPSRF